MLRIHQAEAARHSINPAYNAGDNAGAGRAADGSPPPQPQIAQRPLHLVPPASTESTRSGGRAYRDVLASGRTHYFKLPNDRHGYYAGILFCGIASRLAGFERPVSNKFNQSCQKTTKFYTKDHFYLHSPFPKPPFQHIM